MIKKREDAAKNPSNFVGTVGQKLDFEATLSYIRGFDGTYGHTTIYGFVDDASNRYIWFSSTDLGLIEKEKYKVKATIKDHKQGDAKYGGHKENIVTRAKIQTLDGQKINESIVDQYQEYFIL
jgi:hypothetical protein